MSSNCDDDDDEGDDNGHIGDSDLCMELLSIDVGIQSLSASKWLASSYTGLKIPVLAIVFAGQI